MKPIRARTILLHTLVSGILLASPPLRADITAVTNRFFEGNGFVNGAIAFSFTPTTNLAVTSVGYFNQGAINPIVRIWANTNFPIATWQLVPSSTNGVMVYSNVTLTLLAGRRYSISVQDGPLSPPNPVLLQFYTNTQFQLASQLAGYVGATVNSNGVWGSFLTNYFLLGPNFTFQEQSTPVGVPPLNAFRGGSNLVLAWPSVPTGFVLQQGTDLVGSDWVYLTNTPSLVAGSNQVSIPLLPPNLFFRLIHP